MSFEPKDKKLYENAKMQANKKYEKPSAYKSGYIVKLYKKLFFEKYGADAEPYSTSRKKRTAGLTRWFAEEWRNQRGEVGYSKKGDVYRPTKRITKQTPATFSELTSSQVKSAQVEKIKTGRVKQFKK